MEMQLPQGAVEACPSAALLGLPGQSHAEPSLVLPLQAPLSFSFPPAEIAVYENKPALLILLVICHLSRAWAGSRLLLYSSGAGSAALRSSACPAGLVLFLESRGCGVHPVSSVAICSGAEVGSGWTADVLFIHPRSGKQVGTPRKGGARRRQTPHRPSDSVANHHVCS